MCGLVGVAGNLSLDAVKAFNNMLYIDGLRGLDSTGVASVAFNNDISILKQVGPPLNLIERNNYDAHVSVNKWCIIGHNRFGTVGGKTWANAHPFHHGTVVGAHNGTLQDAAKKRMMNHAAFGTDSEAMIFNISQEGIDKTVEKLSGAWAVTLYDSADNTISLFRNKERPLYYAFSKDRKQLFWASEQLMLIFALRRNNIDFELFELPVGKLYSWVVPRGTNVFGEIVDPPELKEFVAPAYEPRFPHLWRGNHQHYQGNGDTNVVPYKTPAEKTQEERAQIARELAEIPWDDALDPEVIAGANGWSENETLDEYLDRSKLSRQVANKTLEDKDKKAVIAQIEYKNPKTNAPMTEAEFEVITKAGCDWCSKNISWGEAVKFSQDSSGIIECFCFECVDGRDGLNRYLGNY